jgi:hypothetical protein
MNEQAPDSSQALNQEQQEALVAEWLLATPGFFERHAEVLNTIRLKDPNSDRAISLQERQMVLLRSQNHDLNQRLKDMLRFGSRNDQTQKALVAWLLKLITALSPAEVISAIEDGLGGIFEVESVKILNSDSQFLPWVANPICCKIDELNPVNRELLSQFDAFSIDTKSIAVLGLAFKNRPPSALVLASHHLERFTSDMGAFYLKQIAELSAAALDRVANDSK